MFGKLNGFFENIDLDICKDQQGMFNVWYNKLSIREKEARSIYPFGVDRKIWLMEKHRK